MKMKKVLMILGLCAALIFTLAACGDDPDEGTDDAGEDVVQEEVQEDAGDAADFSAIEGAWTVNGLISPEGEYNSLEDLSGESAVDPSSLQATIEFDGAGNLTYEAGGQSLGGTCTFDGETIAITFENGYEMAIQYDEENDALMQTQAAGDSELTLVYYRAE